MSSSTKNMIPKSGAANLESQDLLYTADNSIVARKSSGEQPQRTIVREDLRTPLSDTANLESQDLLYTADNSKVARKISGEQPQRTIVREDLRTPLSDTANLELSKVYKVYMIAGEQSGDYIGHLIMEQLGDFQIVGVGGELMRSLGLKSLFPISEINMMGFFEILPHIFRLKKLINQTINDIIAQNPSVLVTIDSPGFTYRVASAVKKLKPDLKMLHIVAPSVWAYRPQRARKYAKLYDHLLTLLPFEPPYFEKFGLACTYIGHPVLEQKFYSKREIKSKEQSNSLVICVTPGSRASEIKRHLPIFKQAFSILQQKLPDQKLEINFVLARKPDKILVEQLLENWQFSSNITFSSNKLESFAKADIALAKSGTNTFEIAASATPMVVAYKINPLSYLLIKSMIKVKYANLINIIAGKEIIPELIQNDCNPNSIANALFELLNDSKKAQKQLKDTKEILQQLGFDSSSKPSQLGASVIRNIVNSQAS